MNAQAVGQQATDDQWIEKLRHISADDIKGWLHTPPLMPLLDFVKEYSSVDANKDNVLAILMYDIADGELPFYLMIGTRGSPEEFKSALREVSQENLFNILESERTSGDNIALQMLSEVYVKPREIFGRYRSPSA